MNLNTKYVLIGLCVLAGAMLYFLPKGPSTDSGNSNVAPPAPGEGPRILNVSTDHVKKLTIIPAAGGRTVLENDNGTWKMTEPVESATVDFATKDLLDSIVNLHSEGQPSSDPGSAAGLDKPRYKLQIDTDDNKTIHLDIGDTTGTGDLMFARVDNGNAIYIQSSIDKTLKTAGDTVRDKHLFTMKSPDVKQFRITSGNESLAVAQTGGKWQIVEPTPLPGDMDSVSQILSSICSIEATDFVAPDSDEIVFARFNHPTLTLWMSGDAPTTQPATTVPAQPTGGVTLVVGPPVSLAKDHYFVRLPNGSVAKISSDTLALMQKNALDVREREVATIPPAEVTNISIEKLIYPPPAPPAPATVPSTEASTQAASSEPSAPAVVATPPASTQPTSDKTIVLNRRPRPAAVPLGPVAPTTGPSTVASTPTSKPASELSLWQLASEPSADLDDTRVGLLLGSFSPLRADKWIAQLPTEPVLQRYIVELTQTPAGGSPIVHHIEIIKTSGDPSANAVAMYDGNVFQVATSLTDALDFDFHKSAATPLPTDMPGAAGEPGMVMPR